MSASDIAVRRLFALSSSCRACATGGSLSKQVLCLKRNLCYPIQVVGNHAALDRAVFREGARRKDFFIWIRSNPLKSPDSAKRIQGNPSNFIWISLDLFGEAERAFC
jgi:hypothetical protein